MTIKKLSTGSSDEVAVVNTIGQVADFTSLGAYTTDATGALTLTVAQFINGVFVETGSASGGNITTPTAAAIVAAIPNCQVGSRFEFDFVNTGSNTMTLAAGSGVTLTGTVAMATNTSQHYVGVVTNVNTPAVQVVGLLHTAS